MTILQTDLFIVDNENGTETLEYSRLITSILTIPESLWLDTGNIQLTTRLRLTLSDYGNPARGSRYLNPTSSQWGWIALLSEGFVQQQQRIEFQQQEITTVHPEIAIFKCRNSVPRYYGNTVESGEAHFYSISSTPICLTMTGIVTPAPTPTTMVGQGTMPAGSTCLRGLPASVRLLEANLWGANTNHRLQIDRKAYGWFDQIRGVIYPKTRLLIEACVSWDTAENLQPLPALPRLLQGNSPFPVLGFACDLGYPIPAPSNPLCDPIDLAYDATRGNFGCANSVP